MSSGGGGGGGSGGGGTAQGLVPTKSQKSRRKISLPWFRQNSVTNPRAALSRQHTIDSPGSFRFFRQPSSSKSQVLWDISFYFTLCFYGSWSIYDTILLSPILIIVEKKVVCGYFVSLRPHRRVLFPIQEKEQ